MLRALTLSAALLTALALPPAWAQTGTTSGTTSGTTPSTTTPTGRGGTTAAPTARPAPAIPAPTVPSRPTAPSPAPAPAPAAAPAAPPRSPAPSTTTAAAAPTASERRIDVNSASETELAALPGIGPVTAKNIVQGRPWDDLKALVTKKAMPQAVFDRNKDRFALANINTSSAADMAATLPGIGEKTAPKIVNGRPYAAPGDLVTKKVLTERQYEKVKDLITY